MYNQKKRASDTKHWLNVVKSHDRSQVKTAELGGDGKDTSFEQAFSNLAHAYLRDKAPTLLDHEVGFQLLDRNQENTKAVGVFAFKVGAQWIYAPVFFLNGDLKGHELLYVKNQDMFLPLKENWINYLINRKPSILGQGVTKNTTSLGASQPDFSQMSRSPMKFGSANPTLKEMMTAAIGTFAKTATMNTAKAFEEIGGVLNLPSFLKQAGLEMLSSLVNTCKDAPKIAEALDQFHGLDIIKEAVDLAKQRRDAPVKVASILDSAPKKTPNASTLVVITYDYTQQTALPPGLDEDDQEKLLKDKILIKDKRDGDNVSVAYQVQTDQKLFNPNESGLYEVVTGPGDIERCYVAIHPMGPDRRTNMATVVRVDGSPAWLNAAPTSVWAVSRIEGEEFDKWYNALSDATSLPSGNARTLLLHKNGDTLAPVRVEKEYGSSDKDTVAYTVQIATGVRGPEPKPDRRNHTDPLNYCEWRHGVRVHLNTSKGSKLRLSMGDIFVPTTFKKLNCTKAKDDKKDNSDEPCCIGGYSGSEDEPLMLGNIAEIHLGVLQKTAGLTLRHTGTRVDIEAQVEKNACAEKELTPVQALASLVGKHGFTEPAARALLEKAAAKRRFECRVKYAAPYGPPMLTEQGPSAPAMPEPVMGGESIMNSSVPTQLGVDQAMQVPAMSASNTDREIYNPNTGLDKKTMQTIIDAANSGQREIFDTTMIGSMLRAVRDDTMVDRYMGDLMKGLDKLGRILFMFYWHGDQFAERYGKADMPELEDSLRNAFEMVGDVLLFLKQRSIEPYPEEQGNGVDLTATAS
jgi:hypothetical protein